MTCTIWQIGHAQGPSADLPDKDQAPLAEHPAPDSFCGVGLLRGVGVYPLGAVASIFGPATQVWAYGKAYGKAVKPERLTKRGVPFQATQNDFSVAVVELASGPVLRLTAPFYTADRGKQSGTEFQGDDGQLYLSSWLAPRTRPSARAGWCPSGPPSRPPTRSMFSLPDRAEKSSAVTIPSFLPPQVPEPVTVRHTIPGSASACLDQQARA